jgi:hypothetical protein
VVLLTLPFRYRYEINCARPAVLGRSRNAVWSAHYKSVDEWFQRVHSRPEKEPDVCVGPGLMGMTKRTLSPERRPPGTGRGHNSS